MANQRAELIYKLRTFADNMLEHSAMSSYSKLKAHAYPLLEGPYLIRRQRSSEKSDLASENSFYRSI